MKKRVAVVMSPTGKVDIHRLTKKATLEQLQGWVGGYIQPIKVRFNNRVWSGYCDEEGKLKNLPINWPLTKALWSYLNAEWGPYIVGTVVLEAIVKPGDDWMNDEAITGFQLDESLLRPL